MRKFHIEDRSIEAIVLKGEISADGMPQVLSIHPDMDRALVPILLERIHKDFAAGMSGGTLKGGYEWFDLSGLPNEPTTQKFPQDETSRSNPFREKYFERGSGQVFYLVFHEVQQRWCIYIFEGGPEPLALFAAFPNRESAEDCLQKLNCIPFHTSNSATDGPN